MPKKSRAANIVEYDEGRFWFHHKDGVVTLGLTVTAIDEIGSIDSVSLPADGDDFDKSDIVCEVEGEEGKVALSAPAAGFVTEVNTSVESDTAILAEDPIDEGWLVKLEIQDETDLKEFL